MSELEQILADYDAGKPVRSIRLGHGHSVRQAPTYACAFEMMRSGLTPLQAHPHERPSELTQAEYEAAHSLAYSVMVRGWAATISGFPESQLITIQKEKAA